MPFPASIVITTKNRCEDLAIALRSCMEQSLKCEVIVIDDGSEDNTREVVTQNFPEVRYHRSNVSKGLIHQRNFAASLATAPIIISIDDDAEFSAPNIVKDVLEELNADPQIGALAIPFIEPKVGNILNQKAPDSKNIWETDRFIGTAHAIRKDIFLGLGGYCLDFIHQGEEGDFCMRMINQGLIIRMGNTDPIIHHVSPNRNYERMDFYGRRNDILTCYRNVPWPYFPIYMLFVIINGMRFSLKSGRLKQMLRGTIAGLHDIRSTRRNPVSRSTFKKVRRLKKTGPSPYAPSKTHSGLSHG